MLTRITVERDDGQTVTVPVSEQAWPIQQFESGRAYIVEMDGERYTLAYHANLRRLVAHPEGNYA